MVRSWLEPDSVMEFGFYRRHHWTKTAMLRVLSDVLTAVDGRRVTLLGVLDMSAAFDCVYRNLLLHAAPAEGLA